MWPRNGRSDVLRNTSGVDVVGSVLSVVPVQVGYQTARQHPCLHITCCLDKYACLVCVCVCVWRERRCTDWGCWG